MTKSLSYFFLFLTVGSLSCTDQGNTVEYLEILSIQPSPNSINIDKRSAVHLQFNSDVDFGEGAKLLFRYVGDPAPFQVDYRCEDCSPVNKSLSFGPVIWKPGRTVEVSAPSSLADINGRTLREPLLFRFTVAQDSLPFRLVSTRPARSTDEKPNRRGRQGVAKTAKGFSFGFFALSSRSLRLIFLEGLFD